MTQLRIKGPVRITIDGPQGSGKTQLGAALYQALASQGLAVVAYGPEVRRDDRRWRMPYSAETAQVMIVERQGDTELDLLDALAAARAVLTSILGTVAESQIIAEQAEQIDAALAKASGSVHVQQFGRAKRVKTGMAPILAGLPGGEEP